MISSTKKCLKMVSHQKRLAIRQRNSFSGMLLMMLQAPPSHQKSLHKSSIKNIISSSRSAETGTVIFIQAEKKYITGRNLGTRYEEDFLLQTFKENEKSLSDRKMKIEEPQVPNTAKDLQTALSPDASDIPVPFIFIKSDLRLVIDLQTCIKAQQSEAYAQKVKLSNLKQMAQTVAYIQEHGYNSLEDFHTALDQASDQTSAARKSLKDTEQQLKDVNEQIHFTGQYLAYKNVYSDYRKSHNKDKFYEEHRAELSLYDTALRTLKEKSGGNKLPSMKALYAEKDRLIELQDLQREDFSNRRDYERELRTVSANIDMILGKNHEQEQQLEKEQNL